MENNIATISVSVSKVEDKLKQLEQKSDVRYASFEENRKIFEDGLSEKVFGQILSEACSKDLQSTAP